MVEHESAAGRPRAHGRPVEVEDIRASVQAALPEFLRDLERLVNIDCGSYTKSGVDEVADWVEQRLASLGADVVRYPSSDFGDTVVGTFEGRGGGPTALLIGHTDTVFDPGTAARRPFEMRAGRAHGPGVSDMKAGLLAGLYALAALRGAAEAGASRELDTRSWLPVGRVVFIANSDEEIGSPSSEPLIRELAAGADAALVLEAARANGDIVSARKGHLVLRLDVHGRAAHAGVEPEKGRNAVVEAAHKIVAISRLDGSGPGVTVNVGNIQGGTRPNIVPDHATLEVDIRARSRTDLEAVERSLTEIARAATIPDVSASLTMVSRHWPMEPSAASGRLVEEAVAVARSLGFELRDTATGGASDANTTAGMGVPSLDGLGPIGGLDHGPDEYVELDSIVPRTTLLAGLLRSIGRADRRA